MSASRDWRPAFEQQTARINVDDATWEQFRRLCRADGHHISEVLGRLVAAEVDRCQRERDAAKPQRGPRRRVNGRTRERAAESSAPRLFE